MTLLATMLVAGRAWAQVPFGLDPSFRTMIDEQYVNGVAFLPDGGIFISGRIKFLGDMNFRGSAKLLPNGQRDPDFPGFPQTTGGGKIKPWNDQFYVGTSMLVRRLTAEGLIDPSFIGMNTGPYFSATQGGDYHVFPDGRVLISGAHYLSYPQGGFVGLHNLIWFSNEGYLDTTRIHRNSNGVIFAFEETHEGKFLCTGTMTSYEGQPVSRIFRIHPDGELDTTFHVNIDHWGEAFAFHTLEDGRILAGGVFRQGGAEADTLCMIRLLPNGDVDASFTHLPFAATYAVTPLPYVLDIHPLEDGRLIITGRFDHVGGEVRGGIAMLSSDGELLDDAFTGNGCGSYIYQATNTIYKSLSGMVQAPDGSYYIHGGYHGYDDGSTNDPMQRMVSRLHGLNVGVHEQRALPWRVYPNPASTQLTVELEQVPPGAVLLLRDALGREVMREGITGHYHVMRLQGLGSGLYLLEVLQGGRHLAAQRVVVE